MLRVEFGFTNPISGMNKPFLIQKEVKASNQNRNFTTGRGLTGTTFPLLNIMTVQLP